ncbi:MAG: hypothetical protein HUJ51_02600 [Eggerthellaceae bacterium]|nr:hypothetical protein [Eggerthellaceae bacterium]
MEDMIYYCKNIKTLNLSEFYTAKCTTMRGMF